MLACGVGLLVVVVFLDRAIIGIGQNNLTNSSPSLSQIWSVGFGLGNAASFWQNAPNSLYSNILLANLPQLIFSILYFVYNGLYTVMSLAAEWSSYSSKRKGLRVSKPLGHQRSTYYLQLPYMHAIPLMIASGGMHWLISQSFYLLSVDLTRTTRSSNTTIISFTTCGYSAVAMIFALGLGTLMLFCIFVNGFRRIKYDIPPAGSCSLAISSACNPLLEAIDCTMPLQWGVVKAASHEPGHCSFSDVDVSQPETGARYS
ncbi:hypothetical protein BP5796_12279 [Coleophoma crateriformis]|uniref:Uncharacterized protein n=1 Tax=Coleophoma crateriformis TaxID=565419 RepID=A0A3D8Q974_9HELO|nr:hypothetical protein BP5796_12279 [Coleophoma crateriformis]